MKYFLAIAFTAGLLVSSAGAFAGPQSGLRLTGINGGTAIQKVDYYWHHRHWHHRRWYHHHWNYW